MKMTRILALTVLAALMPLASVAVKANTVTLTQGTYSYSDGGEFTAVTSPGAFVGNGYVAATKNSAGTGFQTFCMESQVYFSPGTAYYYTLGQMSQPLTGGGIGSNLPLSTGAAYLYYQFATGNLTGYDYNTANTPADQAARKADAGALQAAIWLLQGGQVVNGFPTGTNSYYNLALANANASYLPAVDILQLWSNYNPATGIPSGAAQNQLVLTGSKPTPTPSVPDGGMTIVLLGGALAALQAMRRKLAA